MRQGLDPSLIVDDSAVILMTMLLQSATSAKPSGHRLEEEGGGGREALMEKFAPDSQPSYGFFEAIPIAQAAVPKV